MRHRKSSIWPKQTSAQRTTQHEPADGSVFSVSLVRSVVLALQSSFLAPKPFALVPRPVPFLSFSRPFCHGPQPLIILSVVFSSCATWLHSCCPNHTQTLAKKIAYSMLSFPFASPPPHFLFFFSLKIISAEVWNLCNWKNKMKTCLRIIIILLWEE